MATERLKVLYQEILASLADAILQQRPLCELQDLVVESHGFRAAMEEWVEVRSGLDLLQLSIVAGHLPATRLLTTGSLSAVFGHRLWDERGDVLNPPLHLACHVGALPIIRYLVEERHCDLTARAAVTYGYTTMDNSEEEEEEGENQNEEEREVGKGVEREKRDSEEEKKVDEIGLDGLGEPGQDCHKPEQKVQYHSKKQAETDCEDGCCCCCVSFPLQTPYEVCLDNEHLNCANYICDYIIGNMDQPLHPVATSSLLHQAAFLGAADHLRLLLEHSHLQYLNDRDSTGHTPLHVAALTAEVDCLEMLLSYGACVNARADHRTCLHIMYWSKLRPDNFEPCTRVLISYNIDVNAMDHNSNTALDYLAWELGQKWYQVSAAWVARHGISEASRCAYTSTSRLSRTPMSDERFRQAVFRCMELLLQAGASTLVHSASSGMVDHTIVHTLLQNAGWPLNSSLCQRPLDVYTALELLFQFGADPNVIARNNNESALTMLLMHSLHEVPVELKPRFVALFLMNGGDVECLIPKPKQYRENYANRRWNIYPVMVALQERHPLAVVSMLYDFMSLRHVYCSLRLMKDKFLWHHMIYTPTQVSSSSGLADGGTNSGDEGYRQEWLAIRRPRLRSLKHCCKLSILVQLGRKACLTESLPLPGALLHYLQSAEC